MTDVSRYGVLILLAFLARPAAAQGAREVVIRLAEPTVDALEPGGEQYGPAADPKDEYAAILRSAFAEAFAGDVLVRQVWEGPQLGVEGATWIGEYRGHFEIRALKSTEWLWRYTSDGLAQAREYHERVSPADYHRVRLKRCQVEIDPSLARRIVALWHKMLLGVRHVRHQSYVEDAGSAYYSMTDGLQFLTAEGGFSESGLPRPKADHLSAIAWGMQNYCEAHKRSDLKEIRQNVQALEQLL